jgi:hypothetical protein
MSAIIRGSSELVYRSLKSQAMPLALVVAVIGVPLSSLIKAVDAANAIDAAGCLTLAVLCSLLT